MRYDRHFVSACWARRLCALLWFGLSSTIAQAPLDIRIALVIGNARYVQYPPLANAGKDSKSISQSLRSLGFTVEELQDSSKGQMSDALTKISGKLQGQQALAMFYYAGHGVQVDWRNYMIPVDAQIKGSAKLSELALDVGDVVEAFRAARTRMNIVVLDACRDNPFPKRNGVGKGLAPMDAPPGTLLAYATQPGNFAEDGEDGSTNGPYAQYLSAELLRPFARVEDVFKRVRYQVRQKTEGRQIPWESTSLEEDLMFNDGTRHTVNSADLAKLAAEAKAREQVLLKQVAQAVEHERLSAAAEERERQVAANAARLAEQQRQSELAKFRETERLATLAREAELQRLVEERRRQELDRVAQIALGRERQRKLEAEQALEQQRLRLLEQQQELEAQKLATEVRNRERLVAAALEAERHAQTVAAQEAEEQRLADLAQARQAELAIARAREQEQLRLANEIKRQESERLVQENLARERELKLAHDQALDRAHQRALEQALAQEREIEAQRQREVDQLDASRKAREALHRLSKEQLNERVFTEEKADWDRLRNSNAASEVYAYLIKYPNGLVSELAQAKLEVLDKPKIQPAPDQYGLIQPFEAKRFTLGDSYQFVVRDILTSVEIERPTFKVIAATAETAEFNQGYKVTQAGAIIRTIAGATLDPFQQWIPSGDYQVGKKWRTRSIMTMANGSKMWVDLVGRVISRETINVPAGSFDTFKMEMRQTAQDGTQLNITYWGQPDWGVAVKQIREIRDTRGHLSGQVYEMVSRKRGG